MAAIWVAIYLTQQCQTKVDLWFQFSVAEKPVEAMHCKI